MKVIKILPFTGGLHAIIDNPLLLPLMRKFTLLKRNVDNDTEIFSSICQIRNEKNIFEVR